MHYNQETPDISKVRKMQKDMAREVIKYIAKNITPKDMDSAFKVANNSKVYNEIFNTKQGLWSKTKEEVLDLLEREIQGDTWSINRTIIYDNI